MIFICTYTSHTSSYTIVYNEQNSTYMYCYNFFFFTKNERRGQKRERGGKKKKGGGGGDQALKLQKFCTLFLKSTK